jgi:hypothetical protein
VELEPDWTTKGTPMSKRSLVRLTDLFVQGESVAMPDGTHLWIQAMNPFERDEAISDASVARSRIVLALKNDGTERLKVAARLAEHGRDAMVSELATVKTDAKTPVLANEIRDDSDWAERISILERTDFSDASKPPTPEELALLEKINSDFIDELRSREEDERQYQTRWLTRLADDELIDEYATAYLDKRGGELSNAEYQLTEMWYSTRWCDATATEDGLDHTPCLGHSERVFETKADARMAPGPLQTTIRNALFSLNMAPRDPKGSGSPVSSSDSSAMPSAPEASTPSTSTGTPA